MRNKLAFSVIELYQLLQAYGYIPDLKFCIELATVLNQPLCRLRGAFLKGGTGTGKTFAVETIAKIMQAQLFYQQCTPGMQEEDLLTKPLPDEKTISGVRLVKQTLPRLFEAIDIDGVLSSFSASTNGRRRERLPMPFFWTSSRTAASMLTVLPTS